MLALGGDSPAEPVWRERAAAFGGVPVVRLDSLPMERRHQAKIDYGSLRRLVGSREPRV